MTRRALFLVIAGIALAAIVLVVFPAPTDTTSTASALPVRHPTPEATVSPGSGSPNQPSTATHRHYELIMAVEQFDGFLVMWNGKMSWGFTPEQVTGFSSEMKQGMLKQYRSPNGLAIEVEEIPAFCHYVGNALGLSPEQSDLFSRTATQYYNDEKMKSFEIQLTIPVTEGLDDESG